MGKKNEIFQSLNIDVKVPTFFRCPISLDVMRSPVSLSSGVTYDRSSIKPWLDSGKKTCPATNLPLSSTDLIPNLTLRRLIHLWSATAAAGDTAGATAGEAATNLLCELQSSSNPSPLLRRLAEFFLNAENCDFAKNAVAGAGAAVVSSIFIQNVDRIESLEAAANLFAVILRADCVEEENKNIAISSLISDLNASVRALLFVLKQGKTSESRADAATILSAILSSSDSETKNLITETHADLIPELIRLINQEKTDKNSIFAGISCLAAICVARRAKLRMVKEGIVAAMVKVLKSEAEMAAEKAMKVLEAVSEVAEGRSEICAAAEDCIAAVIGKMMRVGREGMEAAVVVLWRVCFRFRERRAAEALTAESGGAVKILVLMQSNCSPEVRRMSGDLLRIFGVGAKGCFAGYDTKTTHIMPF